MPATATVTIVGRSYDIACDDGQQDHVRKMAAEVDRRASELLKQVGVVGESRLLVMVALMLTDELSDARAALRAEHDGAAPADIALAGGIEQLAQRLDAIAERLESA